MKKYDLALLDAVPPDYYEIGVKTNILQKIWHEWKWKTLKGLIRDISGNILDIGCAGGMLTQAIKSSLPHSQIVGMDLYKKAIAQASKRYPSISFIVGDAHRLPFPDKKFAAVIATETLEHLHDPKKAVEEIYRILKPKGTFIIGQDSNNLAFRVIWWFWTKTRGRVWKGVHVNCMNPQELAFLLTSSGFHIEKKVYSHLGLEVFFKARKNI